MDPKASVLPTTLQYLTAMNDAIHVFLYCELHFKANAKIMDQVLTSTTCKVSVFAGMENEPNINRVDEHLVSAVQMTSIRRHRNTMH